jgi:hypothetical protein
LTCVSPLSIIITSVQLSLYGYFDLIRSFYSLASLILICKRLYPTRSFSYSFTSSNCNYTTPFFHFSDIPHATSFYILNNIYPQTTHNYDLSTERHHRLARSNDPSFLGRQIYSHIRERFSHHLHNLKLLPLISPLQHHKPQLRESYPTHLLTAA